MRKILLSMAVALSCATGLMAQTVPNASFENGTGNMATGWFPLNGDVDRITEQQFTQNGNTVTQKAVDGQYFMRIATGDTTVKNPQDTTQTVTLALPGIVGSRFAYTDTPKYFVFHAMFLPRSTSDQFSVGLLYTKHNNTSGKSDTVANFVVNGPTGQAFYPWSRFSLALSYGGASMKPDSLQIIFASANLNQLSYGIGTTLWVDSVGLTNKNPNVGIELYPNTSIAGLNLYPNPAVSHATISYELSSAEQISIRVFDMTGRVVANLTEGRMAAGQHKASVDVSGLKNGIYFYQLRAGGSVKTERFIIAH